MRFEFGEPKTEPLTLDRVKDHLRIDHNDLDAHLGFYISSARDLIEQEANISLVEKDLTIWLNGWPMREKEPNWDGMRDGAIGSLFDTPAFFEIPVGPISEVSQISTFDSSGNETVWDSDKWYVAPSENATIHPRENERWPSAERAFDSVKITAKAGYGPDWNHVPPALQFALLTVIAYWYKNPEGSAAGTLPKEAERAIAKFKRVQL